MKMKYRDILDSQGVMNKIADIGAKKLKGKKWLEILPSYMEIRKYTRQYSELRKEKLEEYGLIVVPHETLKGSFVFAFEDDSRKKNEDIKAVKEEFDNEMKEASEASIDNIPCVFDTDDIEKLDLTIEDQAELVDIGWFLIPETDEG